MRCLLLAIVLLMQLSIHAQIDPGKLDSLSRSIDSSAKAYKSSQDSFVKVQDSIYHAAISEDVENNSRDSQLLAEQKRNETKERQQIILRIVTGVVLLAIGVIAVLRKRKTKT